MAGQYDEVGSYNGNKLDDADKTRSEDARFLLTAVTGNVFNYIGNTLKSRSAYFHIFKIGN